jgi:serine/threonine protein kinase/tetratricopeptide (TPR) repeat protein
MHPERWQAIKDVVQGALDREPSDRDRWLASVCGDDALLLAEARTLVRAAGATLGFLESGVSLPVDHPLSPITKSHSGRIVSHYQLHECIGAGAMGEVYRATDRALGRGAALKLLPSTFDSTLKHRLLREAEASARLQHPAIATFYEAGEADSEAFIAMEYVEGRLLRDVLQDGPIPPDDALGIVSCLLEALAHAHAAALLHRDIKPENIIVIGTRAAKLLDFSIALPMAALSGNASEDTVTVGGGRTCEGALVGTIGYLAPEQVAGDSLDARTDIFQVGVVLYEMLTGRAAFPGTTPLERLAALMTSEPDFDVLAHVRLAGRLQDILRTALQREPSKRYPTAAAFLRDVRELTDGRAVGALPRVVAIFDFASRGSDESFEWLGSAIAEEVRATLADANAVRVIPRDKVVRELSQLTRESGTPDPLLASLRLGCGWAVLGRVEVAGSLMRASADVVDVATGVTSATENAGGALKDLPTIQARLAGAIATVISGATTASGQARGNTTFDAQECLTRARLLIERISKGSLDDARGLLERTLAADERNAEALSALATTHALRAIATTDPADYDRALAAADRAIAIDPSRVKAHVWKGYALAVQGRMDEAAQSYDRAIELDPSDTEALYFASGIHLMSPAAFSPEKALLLLQRAVEIDESQGMWWLALGTAHRWLSQSREAIYSFTRAQKLEGTPARFGTAGAAAYVGEMLRLDRRLEEARRHALLGIEAAERSDHAYRDTFRAHGLTVLGRVALDQRGLSAAQAAFNQVLAQARGRPRTRSCGHFVVQALCGLARVTESSALFDEARTLFERQETYNFGTFYGALNGDTLFELAAAARVLGRAHDADALQARAREAGRAGIVGQPGVGPSDTDDFVL